MSLKPQLKGGTNKTQQHKNQKTQTPVTQSNSQLFSHPTTNCIIKNDNTKRERERETGRGRASKPVKTPKVF